METTTDELGVLDICLALCDACNQVLDFEDCEKYYERARDGFTEKLGENSEKSLEATYSLIASEEMSEERRVELFRDLVKRANKSLGADNHVTLDALNDLGEALNDTGQFEEALKVLEESLAGTERALGPDHWKTLDSMNNLGNVFLESSKGEKALEIYHECLGKKKPRWAKRTRPPSKRSRTSQ